MAQVEEPIAPAQTVLDVYIEGYDGVDPRDGRLPPEHVPFYINNVLAGSGVTGMEAALNAVRELPPGSLIVIRYDKTRFENGGRAVWRDPFASLNGKRGKGKLIDLIQSGQHEVKLILNGQESKHW